jgi:hypothetical protein
MAWFRKKKEIDTNSSAYQKGMRIADNLFSFEKKIGTWLNEKQHKVGFRSRNIILAILAILYILFLFIN